MYSFSLMLDCNVMLGLFEHARASALMTDRGMKYQRHMVPFCITRSSLIIPPFPLHLRSVLASLPLCFLYVALSRPSVLPPFTLLFHLLPLPSPRRSPLLPLPSPRRSPLLPLPSPSRSPHGRRKRGTGDTSPQSKYPGDAPSKNTHENLKVTIFTVPSLTLSSFITIFRLSWRY